MASPQCKHQPKAAVRIRLTPMSVLIPLTVPYLGDEEVEAASNVIRSGWVTRVQWSRPLKSLSLCRWERGMAALSPIVRPPFISPCWL